MINVDAYSYSRDGCYCLIGILCMCSMYFIYKHE